MTKLRQPIYTLLAITLNAAAGIVLIGGAPDRFPSGFVLAHKVVMIASAPVALLCLFWIWSELSFRARVSRMDKDLAEGWSVAGVIARERRSRLVAVAIGSVVALLGLWGRSAVLGATFNLGMTALMAFGVAFVACSAVMLAATFLPLSADIQEESPAEGAGGERIVRRGRPSPYFLREAPLEPLDDAGFHRPGRGE